VIFRLDKFKNKTFLYFFLFILGVFFLSCIIPFFQFTCLGVLKYPLGLLNLMRRELGGIVFYHHNLVQNERLKRSMDLLRQKLNNVREVYLENMRLKEMLSFKQRSHYKLVAARVIGRSPDNWFSMVIIDKGKDYGLRRGMVAITPAGLLGRVLDVTGSTTKIMLINDPNFSVSSLVQRSRQEGLVSGTLGGTLMMKYLPRNADIKVSDIIVTSGLTDLYPKGLIIGTVIEVGDEFAGLTRYALLKPAVDLANIEELLIILE